MSYAVDVKTEKRTRLAEWLATPKYLRNPPGKRGLCQELGVTKVTLIAWEKELAKLQKEKAANEDNDRLKAVKDMLYKEAVEKGKVNAAELYLRATGQLVDKTETKLSLELSADQIDKATRDAEARVRAELVRLNCGVDSVQEQSAVLLQ